MAWRNAFDIGPCEIDVYWYGSQVDPADRGWTLSVDGGVVTLSGDGEYSLDGAMVIVRPLYDTAGVEVRISGTTVRDHEYPATHGVMEFAEIDERVELVQHGDTYDPDPIAFQSDGGGMLGVGIEMVAIG